MANDCYDRQRRILRVSQHNRVLDLNDEGERWEGDVLDGNSYGWGVLYDEDNQIVYEGFKLDYHYEGYGRTYYPDLQRVEYEGGWWGGDRWGKGTLYDRNGKVIYDGEWMNMDHWSTKLVVEDYCDFLGHLHTGVEELIVNDNVQLEEENGPP